MLICRLLSPRAFHLDLACQSTIPLLPSTTDSWNCKTFTAIVSPTLVYSKESGPVSTMSLAQVPQKVSVMIFTDNTNGERSEVIRVSNIYSPKNARLVDSLQSHFFPVFLHPIDM